MENDNKADFVIGSSTSRGSSAATVLDQPESFDSSEDTPMVENNKSKKVRVVSNSRQSNV